MRRALLGLLVAAAAGPWAFAQSSRPAILSRLIWFDRAGQRLGSVGPIADHGNLEISPDGTRVAVAVTDVARATRDIWFYHLASGERTQFTSDPADENWLIWSPDGARVLLNSFTRERLSLLEGPSTDASKGMPVLGGDEGKWPVSWSPDGRYVLYVTNNDRTSNDIWVLLRDGTGSPYPYLHTAAVRELGVVLAGRSMGGVQRNGIGATRSLRRAVSGADAALARVGRRRFAGTLAA